MLSHPAIFLIGYLLVTFILAFVVLGPAVVFAVKLFARHMEKRYVDGVYLGAAVTGYGFMILHYLLYLRGYAMTDWTQVFGDIFYPPASF